MTQAAGGSAPETAAADQFRDGSVLSAPVAARLDRRPSGSLTTCSPANGMPRSCMPGADNSATSATGVVAFGTSAHGASASVTSPAASAPSANIAVCSSKEATLNCDMSGRGRTALLRGADITTSGQFGAANSTVHGNGGSAVE